MRDSSFNSSGIAVISFDFSSQATCPNVGSFSLDHAVTRCSIALPDCLANERRRLLIKSNLAFSDWGQIFQGERMTAALLDRPTRHRDNFRDEW